MTFVAASGFGLFLNVVSFFVLTFFFGGVVEKGLWE